MADGLLRSQLHHHLARLDMLGYMADVSSSRWTCSKFSLAFTDRPHFENSFDIYKITIVVGHCLVAKLEIYVLF